MGAAFSASGSTSQSQSPLLGAAAARLMPIRSQITVIESKEQKEQREKEEKEQQATLKKLGM